MPRRRSTTDDRQRFGRPLKQYVRVGPAEVAYLTDGDPDLPPVLFLHGVTTTSALWQKVVKRAAPYVHGVAIDLMGLGDTRVSPYEDLTMPAQAEMLLELFERFGWSEATVVAHDHGGAVAQILAANHPEVVSNLLLVDSVGHDHWPIPLVREAVRIARLPGTAEVLRATALARRWKIAWDLTVGPLGFARGYYDPSIISAELIEEYLRPYTTWEGRERARRFLLAADNRSTMEILDALGRFDRPSRVLWGADDKFLSLSWGIDLAESIPGARLHLLPYCGHFAPDERPDLVLAHLLDLMGIRSMPADADAVDFERTLVETPGSLATL